MPRIEAVAGGSGVFKGIGKVQNRLWLNPDDPHYDKVHLWLPDPDDPKYLAGYQGKLKEDGTPVDQKDFDDWWASLVRKWIDVPFHNHKIWLPPDGVCDDNWLKEQQERTLTYFYNFHQHCWDTGQQFCGKDKDGNIVGLWERVPFVKGSIHDVFVRGEAQYLNTHETKIADVLSRVQEFQIGVSKVPPTDLNIGEKGTIDVGTAAIARPGWREVIGLAFSRKHTTLVVGNPANASGSLDTVQAYFNTATSGATGYVGAYYLISGVTWKCRDGESVGELVSGSQQEYTGLSIDIETDDLLGITSAIEDVGLARIESTESGSGYQHAEEHITAGEQDDFELISGYTISLYGTGEEAGGGQEVTPSPVTAATQVQSPTVSGSGSAPITASAVQAAGYVQAPVLSGSGSAPISASPVQAAADIPTHAASTGEQFVSALPVTAASSVPTHGFYHSITEQLAPADKDCWINELNPDTNHGSTEDLFLWDYTNYTERTIVEVELPELPSGALAIGARLELYCYYIDAEGATGTKIIKAYKLTRTDWVESEATWNSYKSGSSWTTAGGDYVTSDPSGGSLEIPAYAPSYNVWLSIPVDEIVQDAYDSEINARFLLKFETEGLDADEQSTVSFYSSDYTSVPAYRPKLTVFYNPGVFAEGSPITVEASVPTATVSGGGSAPITASPVTAAASVPTATVTSPIIVTASPVSVAASVPVATLSGSGSTSISPSPVQAAGYVAVQAVSAGLAALAVPVTAAAYIVSPSVSGVGSAAITPSPVAVAASVVAPVITGGGLMVLASPVTVSASIISHIVSGSGSATILSSSVQVVASVFLASMIMPGRLLTARVVTSLYRNTNIVTSQYRRVRPMTSLYRKAKVITSGG